MFDFVWVGMLVVCAGVWGILRVNHIKAEREMRWVVLAFVFVFVIRSFLWEPYKTDGPSMIPTLPDGTLVVVDKSAYGITVPLIDVAVLTSYPKINEIVAFHHNQDMWIKRVKGNAGDKILYVAEGWFINGVLVAPQTAGTFDVDRFERSLPSSSRFSDTRQWKETGTFELTIPSGYFFAMGDNPSHSTDSRTIGVVPYRKIAGRVYWRGS